VFWQIIAKLLMSQEFRAMSGLVMQAIRAYIQYGVEPQDQQYRRDLNVARRATRVEMVLAEELL
jgi:hypothetical protein